jgi:hypothetical protein
VKTAESSDLYLGLQKQKQKRLWNERCLFLKIQIFYLSLSGISKSLTGAVCETLASTETSVEVQK